MCGPSVDMEFRTAVTVKLMVATVEISNMDSSDVGIDPKGIAMTSAGPGDYCGDILDNPSLL